MRYQAFKVHKGTKDTEIEANNEGLFCEFKEQYKEKRIDASYSSEWVKVNLVSLIKMIDECILKNY